MSEAQDTPEVAATPRVPQPMDWVRRRNFPDLPGIATGVLARIPPVPVLIEVFWGTGDIGVYPVDDIEIHYMKAEAPRGLRNVSLDTIGSQT